MTDVQIPSPIVATRVAEADRLRFLPTYFGPSMLRMLRGEALVFGWMGRLCAAYHGGFWHFYTLSNGGFYMAPEHNGRLRIEVDGNGFAGELSADAAGIVATLFALNQLCAELAGTADADALIDRYHHLAAFASEHAEAAAIYRAID